MIGKSIGPIVGLLLQLFLATGLQAHGGHDERIKVLRNPSLLSLDMQLSADDLKTFDTNGDGLLTSHEFLQQMEAIKSWVGARISLRMSSGNTLKPEFFDIPVAVGNLSKENAPVEHVRVLQTYGVPEKEPLALSVNIYQQGQKKIVLMRNGAVHNQMMNARQIRLWID